MGLGKQLLLFLCRAFSLRRRSYMWSSELLRRSTLWMYWSHKLIGQGYYHTPEAAASGLTKRKQREAAASNAAARLSVCPNGWTACSIGGSDEGYEVSPIISCVPPVADD